MIRVKYTHRTTLMLILLNPGHRDGLVSLQHFFEVEFIIAASFSQ